MKLFIVGKLGEVIKKVIELEDAITKTENRILVIELSAYNQVLKMWPISIEVDKLTMAIDVFRFNMAKLKVAEDDLRSSKVGIDIMFSKNRYMRYLDLVRSDLVALNDIGKHIGPSPLMELEDAMAKS